ncbi:RNA polymerase sigma factor, sigma-70 family [Pseudovibrio ascidiaceicola]|uniref:RNA polymerase sigma factor, sigma-70 family n=1 Tax=Pseudovibrio ascidiaceicola TaxID=285279 RepID=A0A1I4FTJ6_9HYPH|nr:RNA polymerase sigma factor, sigma-70 family [Pseudovibrio ascidiaceicola]
MSPTLALIFMNERRSLIGSILRIVKDPGIAEDLSQEAYLRAQRTSESQQISHVEGFLHQTARNLALDHLRRSKTRQTYEMDNGAPEALDSVPADVYSLENALIERERFREFRNALSCLPSRAQTVIVLSRIEEWPNHRIAKHLNVSERTVFNDLKLAMAHCRDALHRLERK